MNYQIYGEYRLANADWIEQIPAHWEKWKVSHGFALVGSGTTPKSDTSLYYGGDTLWVTTAELRESVVYETVTHVTREALAAHPTLRKYPKGSLVIAMYGATIGRLGILGNDATVNQACCVFAFPEKFLIGFLYFWLWMRRPILISLSSGGGQPNLNQEDLKRLRIPIPPIREQQQIAAFLDWKTGQIDALIAKKKELIEKLKEKRLAVITQAVTKGLDTSVPMRDSGIPWLGSLPKHWKMQRARFAISANPPAPRLRALKPDDEISFIPMDAVGIHGGLNLEQTRLLADVGSGYTEFQDGDVVVAKITPCFENGKAAIAHGLINGAAYGTTELHILRAGASVEKRFLFYVVTSDTFSKIGESEMYGAGGQKRVPPEFIKNFLMLLPPLGEQIAIANYLDTATEKIDLMVNKTESVITHLSEYRTALITAATTGKIDVRQVAIPAPT